MHSCRIITTITTDGEVGLRPAFETLAAADIAAVPIFQIAQLVPAKRFCRDTRQRYRYMYAE